MIRRLNPLTNSKLIRLSSSLNLTDFGTRSKFTPKEQEKILNTLNACNADQLSELGVAQTRIKSLEKWRRKEGPFESLDDVLEVDGFSYRILERLCDNIISETPVTTNGTLKSRQKFLTPALDNEQSLSTAVGLYLGPSGISWAKLLKEENQISSWSYIDFSPGKKKISLDTFQLAMRILKAIPTGNAYIFEAPPSMLPQGNKQASLTTSYNPQFELMSMLFALINTSTNHNHYLNGKSNDDHINCIYYLKANASARLFNTLIGSERISSAVPVTNILQKNDADLLCSPVNVDKLLQHEYYSQLPVVRELLGQALLLTVTFMDLCVYKNPTSLMALSPGRRWVKFN